MNSSEHHRDRRQRPLHGFPWVAGYAVSLAGCNGVQSALAPASPSAESLAQLFWWMAGGAVLIWCVVVGLGVFAMRSRAGVYGRRATAFIIGGGAVFPTVVLAGLLAYGLQLLPELMEPAPEGSLRIEVTGEQWWWRVRYVSPDGPAFELANEIHLPVGEPVEFVLKSADVIHSFWVPSLGGKVDMVPGRTTSLSLEPTKTGIFRGVCAEYCGTSHALMAFYTVVQNETEYERWRDAQAAPAARPQGKTARRGRELFMANGCGACHTIRGTEASGEVGPDLTHVGSRLSLGAGIEPNEVDDFIDWISRTAEIKPGVHMPAFGMLPDAEIRAIAIYLNELD